jgi:hypothetical protein
MIARHGAFALDANAATSSAGTPTHDAGLIGRVLFHTLVGRGPLPGWWAVAAAGSSARAQGTGIRLRPLFWSNITPYGTFHLDIDSRLDLELIAA